MNFQEAFEAAEQQLDYWVEGAVLDFTEDICRLMDEEGVSRTELAGRLGSSQAYVTKILRGEANFTLKTMAKMAMALDAQVRVHVAPQSSTTHWKDEIFFWDQLQPPLSAEYIAAA